MARLGLVIVSSLIALVATSTIALANERVALVIGNSAYEHTPKLINPRNDATDFAAVLEKIGFDVTLVLDQTYDQMRRTLSSFEDKARRADIAAVYFAGHGIEISSQNYLIPVDAELKRDTVVAFEAIPLDMVLGVVDGARQLRLVMLDACRDNPFLAAMERSGATRSIARGLARVEPQTNSILSYAAKEGTTAADGEGRNSPYTAALIAHLAEPGVEVGFVFRRIRTSVLEATGNTQEPFIYQSLGSDPVYLVPAAAETALPAEQSDPTTPHTNSDDVGLQAEIAFWNTVRELDDPEMLGAYLSRYPAGVFADLARMKLAALAPLPSEVADDPTVNSSFVSAADVVERVEGAVVTVIAEFGSADGTLPSAGIAAPPASEGSSPQDSSGQSSAQNVEPEPSKRHGSGFVVSDGYIVTSHTLIDNALGIVVRFAGGDSAKAEVVGTDSETDISLLRVEQDGATLQSLEFTARGGGGGDHVLIFGTSFGLDESVRSGTIIGFSTEAGAIERLEIDAAFNLGNVGGPLVDSAGQVVGVNTHFKGDQEQAARLVHAIPANVAAEVVRQLKQGKIADTAAIEREKRQVRQVSAAPSARMFRKLDELSDLETRTKAFIASVRVGKGEVDSGAGFFISEDGLFVTSQHLIDGASEIKIVHGGVAFDAEVIGADRLTDLALLKANKAVGLQFAQFSNGSPRVGDQVFSFAGVGGAPRQAETGIVSALNRDIQSGPYDQYQQLDLGFSSTDAGMPVFNLDGEVVGVAPATVSAVDTTNSISFAIPGELARKIVDALRESGIVRRGWLGVQIQPMTEELADSLGLETKAGALVAGLTADGPAAAAGIEAGDVILTFDGREVAELRDLPRFVAETPIGKRVEVTMWRAGNRITRDVVIARLEE